MFRERIRQKLLTVLCILIMIMTGCSRRQVLWSGAESAQADTVSETGSGGTLSGTAEETAAGETAVLYVYVCGQVAAPDVYEMSPGDRVYQAIDAAGGALPEADLTALNLADLLSDGEKIYVPAEGEDGESVSQAADDGRVCINTASEETLMTLPGIGQAKAAAIIAYREAHGAFTDISEITSVPGIGQGIYDQISSMIKIN